MKIEFTALRSRIGKRAFLFLTLLIIVPIGIAIVIATENISRQLTKQAWTELGRASKGYGLSVYERLQIIEEKVSEIGDLVIRKDASLNLKNPRIEKLFETILLVQDRKISKVLYGNPSRILNASSLPIKLPLGKKSTLPA